MKKLLLVIVILSIAAPVFARWLDVPPPSMCGNDPQGTYQILRQQERQQDLG